MTGGGAGPATGGGVGGGGGLAPSGPYVTNPRGPTSRYELTIDWDYPVYQGKSEAKDERTAAVAQRHALALADAFAFIAKEDHRPLLVLRECLSCSGTDDALMTRKADNERTMLMSRWFHCVKLPPDVLQEDHPFHSLFASEAPGHLFFARWDGSSRAELNGQQSRTELWGLMQSLLDSEYQKKAEPTLKQLLGFLDDFDRIDGELRTVKAKIDDEIEKSGASAKLAKLQKELDELEVAKTKARADAVKVSELKLKEIKDAAKKTAEVASPAGAPEKT